MYMQKDMQNKRGRSDLKQFMLENHTVRIVDLDFVMIAYQPYIAAQIDRTQRKRGFEVYLR